MTLPRELLCMALCGLWLLPVLELHFFFCVRSPTKKTQRDNTRGAHLQRRVDGVEHTRVATERLRGHGCVCTSAPTPPR